MLFEWYLDLFEVFCVPIHNNKFQLFPRYVADFYSVVSPDVLIHITYTILKLDQAFQFFLII